MKIFNSKLNTFFSPLHPIRYALFFKTSNMTTLIIKLGAAGDVVRTTSLLRVLPGEVDWVTSDANAILLDGIDRLHELIPWSRVDTLDNGKYDLVINLEDSLEAAGLLRKIRYGDHFGAFLNGRGSLTYNETSREWFDLSLISRFGKERADQLKYQNRKSYQEMLFEGLGFNFSGEEYVLPEPVEAGLKGDIAIAPEAGPVWPNKKWAYYEDLANKLVEIGYRVNILPMRSSILEHIDDVKNHRCLVSGDTLPMHIALGSGVKCVTLFTCTSPWEIYDYGIQEKIISPCLEEFFYSRTFAHRAITSIQIDEVLDAIRAQIPENGME
jgi:heptosyltransferase-2